MSVDTVRCTIVNEVLLFSPDKPAREIKVESAASSACVVRKNFLVKVANR